MTDRLTKMNDFVAAAGWQDAARETVAGDASNRRYDRLTAAGGQTSILMDAPPDKGEDVRPFIKIADFLRSAGLSAPRILSADTENGFLLLEDLGDDLFARVLEENPALEAPLYIAAADVLAALHRIPPPTLAPYDAATMTPLAALAFDWYQFGATGVSDAAQREAFCAAFTKALAPLDHAATALIQRDYHAENLLWMPEREGVGRVGLLDFQDAMLGHPAYDLVSILQDARRDVPTSTEAEILAHFCRTTGQDVPAFKQAYALLGLQRNLRILGVFARLCMRDGKAHYVDLIPRVWGHIQTNLAHPDLTDFKTLLAGLPTPDTKTLMRIKEKCGQCQTM